MDLDAIEGSLGEVLAYTEQAIVCLDDNDMVSRKILRKKLVAYARRVVMALKRLFFFSRKTPRRWLKPPSNCSQKRKSRQT